MIAVLMAYQEKHRFGRRLHCIEQAEAVEQEPQTIAGSEIGAKLFNVKSGK